MCPPCQQLPGSEGEERDGQGTCGDEGRWATDAEMLRTDLLPRLAPLPPESSMLALSSRDIPLLMALFAFGGVLTLLGILLADILYVIADPRINFESRI